MDIKSKSKKRIDKAVDDLCEDYPVLAPILIRMDLRPNDYCPTLQVNEAGRGIFNSKFVGQFDNLQVKFLVMHEAYHILLKHLKRFLKHEDVNSVKDKENLFKHHPSYISYWNIAADSVINENLMVSLPAGSAPMVEGECNLITYNEVSKIIEKSISEIENMSTESIYDLIKEKKQEEEDNNARSNLSSNSNSQEDGGGNSTSESNGGESNSTDGSNGGGGATPTECEIYEMIQKEFEDDPKSGEEAAESMEQAVSEVERVIGSNYSNGAGSSQKKQSIVIGKSIDMNNINWKNILSEFVYNASGRGSSNRTWRKPSRRYRDIYPISKGNSRKAGTRHFTFSIDVSGSMNQNKIKKVVGIVDNYAKDNNLNCKYFFFSNSYSEIFDFTDMKKFEKDLVENYGGGTSLESALRLNDVTSIGDGLIIITDMEFNEYAPDKVTSIGAPVVFMNIEPNNSSYHSVVSSYKEKYEKENRYVEMYS